MTAPVSIEALKCMQRDLGLADEHLVHVAQTSFSLAHTDAERQAAEPLEDCEVHRWLSQLDEAPTHDGFYVVRCHDDPDQPFTFSQIGQGELP